MEIVNIRWLDCLVDLGSEIFVFVDEVFYECFSDFGIENGCFWFFLFSKFFEFIKYERFCIFVLEGFVM